MAKPKTWSHHSTLPSWRDRKQSLIANVRTHPVQVGRSVKTHNPCQVLQCRTTRAFSSCSTFLWKERWSSCVVVLKAANTSLPAKQRLSLLVVSTATLSSEVFHNLSSGSLLERFCLRLSQSASTYTPSFIPLSHPWPRRSIWLNVGLRTSQS